MAGLTPQETAVMELRDKGLTDRNPVRVKVQQVARIIAMYDGAGDETRHKIAMRQGSAALLSAIERAEARQ